MGLQFACSSGENRSMEDELLKAAAAIAGFGTGRELTTRIGAIEEALVGQQRRAAERTIADHGIDDVLLKGALTIKQLAGQIHVVIHVLGILVALPHILERDERIESVSIGAGNTGREPALLSPSFAPLLRAITPAMTTPPVRPT